ncbi:MAG: undecaprenyldiphospho-muramoylpentapeptide beta-N-acetylglucosaminyltransferase [Bacteroidetes bacterium GWE2_29_8]|nr:MAG: undecaprenyldiphospho-muramoylpentapeptide beta-N-acetylglucosaminyltransferase [Bacteroidetes bacterium GWE2_29_8]OFY15662.1 MAG: undecaprenyldiphospho-muramoylpentapeptide beta-N-acetylglucosaminyltransferase [Bacteroidetes bacterium GWF2_29_10]
MDSSNIKIIIAGGGTGGHIFPAIAIANELKDKLSIKQENILFVGSSNRMEMKKVPEAGYNIKGLWIEGFNRKSKIKNIKTICKIIFSLIHSLIIIIKFNPKIVIGVGGYSSGPILFVSSLFCKKCYIQEQNSYAGITNKLLSKYVRKIFVAYPNMDKFFNANKILLTGNPIRKDIIENNINREEALKYFGLLDNKKTILVLGGSLGSRTINNVFHKHINSFINQDIQVLWQTGKTFKYDYKNDVNRKGIVITEFIDRMDYAYNIADLVISRAGAIAISELAINAKPSILVPSPNVTEDHQTVNANTLVAKRAAIMIGENEVGRLIIKKALDIISDDDLMKNLSENIKKFAFPNATQNIVEYIINDINGK